MAPWRSALLVGLAAAGCVEPEPPEVWPSGQLRSGDVAGRFAPLDRAGFTFAAEGGGGGAQYAIFEPAELRAALDGRWLYFAGDSSLRGLFLALLQQAHAPARVAREPDGAPVLAVHEWLAERDDGAPRARDADGADLSLIHISEPTRPY